MQTVLIVEPGDSFREKLCQGFRDRYRVFACGDAGSALELLRQEQPDILILSLFLADMDGLTFLEEAGSLRPPIVLCTSVHTSNYVLQATQDMGVGYVMLKPCPVWAIVRRAEDMCRRQAAPSPASPRAIVKRHLDALGYPAHRDGTKQLLVGVPLFAQDTSQLLSKELYPAIASLCDCRAASIEYSIRSATEDAWKLGSKAWKKYFPRHTHCPTNKEILICLAEFLLSEQ